MLWAASGKYTSAVAEMPGKLVHHQDIRYQCANGTFSVLRQKEEEMKI
jgi:hypothetical protein